MVFKKVHLSKVRKGVSAASLKKTTILSLVFLNRCFILKDHFEYVQKILKRKIKTNKFVFKQKLKFFKTKKPLSRMGKGSGSIDSQIFKTKLGSVFISASVSVATLKRNFLKSPTNLLFNSFRFAGVYFEVKTYKR